MLFLVCFFSRKCSMRDHKTNLNDEILFICQTHENCIMPWCISQNKKVTCSHIIIFWIYNSHSGFYQNLVYYCKNQSKSNNHLFFANIFSREYEYVRKFMQARNRNDNLQKWRLASYLKVTAHRKYLVSYLSLLRKCIH